MKKVVSIISLLCLLISLTACANFYVPQATEYHDSLTTVPTEPTPDTKSAGASLVTFGNLVFENAENYPVEFSDGTCTVELDGKKAAALILMTDIQDYSDSDRQLMEETLMEDMISTLGSRTDEQTLHDSVAGFDAEGVSFYSAGDSEVTLFCTCLYFSDGYYVYHIMLVCHGDDDAAPSYSEQFQDFLDALEPSDDYITLAGNVTEPAAETKPQTQTEPPAQTEPQTQAEPPVQTEDNTPPKSDITTGQRNALECAKRYLDVMPFSYNGLIDQLEYEKFSHEDAVYAADHCGADWYEQAEKYAINYLNSMPFSYSGLIDQLEYSGFTNDEATYGADHCEADWFEQAVKAAKKYLDFMSFSRDGLIEQLEYEGYTHEQAVYGVEANGL